MSTFLLAALLATSNAQGLAEPQLAARCGSELDWAQDWSEAASRAEDLGLHVLVVVNAFPGFDLPDLTRSTTFMDEDILALIRARLVPLRFEPGMQAPFCDPSVYGLGPTTFGSSLLLVDEDGAVLADTPISGPSANLPWLWQSLARHPEPHEATIPAAPLDAALLYIERGELELAEEQLERFRGSKRGPERARAQRLWARLFRLRGEGPLALRALAKALEAAPEQAGPIACEQAVVLSLESRPSEAKDILLAALSSESGAYLPRALYLLSTIEPLLSDASSARVLRERLVEEYPESRWAWLAAVASQLEDQFGAVGLPLALGWKPAEVLEVLSDPQPKVLPARSTKRAVREALAWLLEHQREDGSWPSPKQLLRHPSYSLDPFTAAVDALAVRALLQRGRASRSAAERGLAFLIAADLRRRAEPEPVLYMDLTAWACWAQLELVADALDAHLGDAPELRAFAGRLIGDLRARQRANGGWSYFVSGTVSDGASADGDQLEQSISFITAAVLQALVRAREAGLDVPDELIEDAIACLGAMRDEAGLFAYMLYHPGGYTYGRSAPGAAGRSPACELALHNAERSDDERLLGALELFGEHSGALSAELGKALMHAGPDGQGCHYLFYDYLMASRTIACLPGRQVRKQRALTLELVLAARLEDGSFQDTPLNGRVYSTAVALLTLNALGH